MAARPPGSKLARARVIHARWSASHDCANSPRTRDLRSVRRAPISRLELHCSGQTRSVGTVSPIRAIDSSSPSSKPVSRERSSRANDR
eukprot:602187-Prymnesium_polylepis.3